MNTPEVLKELNPLKLYENPNAPYTCKHPSHHFDRGTLQDQEKKALAQVKEEKIPLKIGNCALDFGQWINTKIC